jgi:hypothetical protein
MTRQPFFFESLERIAELSNPHMRAMNEDLTEEFPDSPDAVYTAAFAFQLCVLLQNLRADDLPEAVNLINALLAKTQLVPHQFFTPP